MKLTKALSLLAIAMLTVFIACQKEIEITTPTPPSPPVLNAPIIISFAPDSVKPGGEVIIKGRYFDPALANNQVSVNSIAAAVIQVTDTTIRFKVNTGSTTGKITLVTGGQTVTTATDLRILNAVIISFAPDSVQVDEDVLIKGKYFDPAIANNQVAVNGTAATVLLATDTTVRFKVAAGSTTGKITLITGGQTITTATDLKIYSNPWIQKANFPEALAPVGAVNGLVLSFSSATSGYIYKSNKLWQYNTTTNSWSTKTPMPSTKGHNFGFCFAIGNKAYLGLGVTGEASPASQMTKEVWEYDMSTDAWTRKADFPGSKRSGCFSFGVGNVGYVGGGDTMNGGFNQVRDFWKYDPSSDTWTRLADYPGNKLIGSMGFNIQSTGYVFEGSFGTMMAQLTSFPDFKLWSFDPATNTWLQKASLVMAAGKPATSATVFAINNKGYAAVGATDTTNVAGQLTKKDFFEYDPVVNAWSLKPQVGGPVRYFPCSFAVAGKGYVGMGTGNVVSLQHLDFWQYNPQ